MDSTNRFAIGVDVSDRTACVCVMDRSGILSEFTVLLTEDCIQREVPHVAPAMGVVVLETGPRSAWLKQIFEKLDFRVVVADARKLAAVSSSPTKTDRNDARMLARLGLADELVAAHGSAERLLSDTYVRPPEDQAIYDLLQARDLLVRRRGDFARLVKSDAKGLGTLITGSVTKDKLPERLQRVLGPLCDVIAACDDGIHAYDQEIDSLAKSHPVATKFLSIPGVGPITALAFAVVIGDPHRFSNIRDVGAYLGLVVRRDQSGNMDPALGISKAGNGFMRRLLVQCATHILGPRGQPSELRTWGLSFMERRGPRAKKKARIAVARKLSVRMLRIWKTDEAWLPFPNGVSNETPSATDGGVDCVVPPDAIELAPREIAAAPTEPTQPCARPAGSRTDESAERRRSPRSASPTVDKGAPAPRVNPAPVGRQGSATPSARAELACAGGPADPCLPTGRRVQGPVRGLNEVQPPAEHLARNPGSRRGRGRPEKGTQVERRCLDGGAAS